MREGKKNFSVRFSAICILNARRRNGLAQLKLSACFGRVHYTNTLSHKMFNDDDNGAIVPLLWSNAHYWCGILQCNHRPKLRSRTETFHATRIWINNIGKNTWNISHVDSPHIKLYTLKTEFQAMHDSRT